MFKFNSADNSKSDEEYPNEQYEYNHQCPSVFWSPRKTSFQEDSEYNSLMLETTGNMGQHNDNPSMQSPISSVYNSEILNFASFGRNELKPTANFRLMRAGFLENEGRPDFRLASFPVYGGCKENGLAGLTMTQMVYSKQSTIWRDFQLEEKGENQTADTQVRFAK